MTNTLSLSPASWRKSSYSGPSGGECVEVAGVQQSFFPVVPVRDSKDISRGHIAVPSSAWAEFTDTIRL
ncbi:DUF397 domain-containing protein [Yinghuangia sp. YIM S10712]|uniref:DUF397 domain-containing protein n=1 Tax=Yinghuangia sp. YIM S10712 TaxID=3436930 RepID=UPI003F531C02